jgi:hypothetical protein
MSCGELVLWTLTPDGLRARYLSRHGDIPSNDLVSIERMSNRQVGRALPGEPMNSRTVSDWRCDVDDFRVSIDFKVSTRTERCPVREHHDEKRDLFLLSLFMDLRVISQLSNLSQVIDASHLVVNIKSIADDEFVLHGKPNIFD